MSKNYKIQVLNSIEKPSDLFDFIWKCLRVPLARNARGVMELFSWALGDWEDGPYATDERTITGWLRNETSSIDRPHVSAKRRSTHGQARHTLLEEFASVIVRNGFEVWDENSSPPTRADCELAADVIVKALQNKLRRKRGKQVVESNGKGTTKTISRNNITSQRPVESPFQIFCRERIGYLSRADFLIENATVKISIKSESEIFSVFMTSSTHKYLILHGPGGSGKTSTLNYIASLAEQVGSIHVSYVKAAANLQVDDLLQLEEGKTHVVFVDYVEKCNSLRELAAWVEGNQHVDVKFVLACRNSSFEKIRVSLNPRHCVGESIDVEFEGKSYQEWIVKTILTRIVGENVDDNIIGLCGKNPAIAAYFVYQFSQETKKGVAEADSGLVGRLQSFDSFKDWLASRLCLALGKPHNELGLQIEDTEVAQIFFCLPAPARSISLTPVLEALIDDGFIVPISSEDGEIIYVPIHDVFADMAIGLWLDSAATPTQRLRLNDSIVSIPEFCNAADCWQSFFITLDRLNLSTDPIYAWADFSKATSNFILKEYQNGDMIDAVTLLINCREIEESSKCAVLKAAVPSRDDLSAHDYRFEFLVDVFSSLLDLASNVLSQNYNLHKFVIELIEAVIEQERTDGIEHIVGRGSTKLAITAYEHTPERYKEYLLQRFSAEWRSNWKVLYILISLVNSKNSDVEFSTISNMFDRCAKRYYSERDFGYLLHYWILKFGTSINIRKYFCKWMFSYSKSGDRYFERKEGFILITIWIRGGGKLQGISSVITQWAVHSRVKKNFGICHLINIFFGDDQSFSLLSRNDVVYMRKLAFYALRSDFDARDPFLKCSIVENLFLRSDSLHTIFRYVSNFMSDREIAYLLRTWRQRINFEFFMVLYTFQKLPTVMEGETRRKFGSTLAAIDKMLTGHPARLQFRKWIYEWLSHDDKGRKSFFHAWYSNYATLEPFQRQAIDCYYYGENKAELDQYGENAEWVSELKRLILAAH